MSIVLKNADDLLPQVERILARLFAEIRGLLPNVELHHVGATALPGALTKGDIDILVRVPQVRFHAVVDVFNRRFAVKQPENWTPIFASFGDDTGYDLPVGIQVVVKDSNMDFLLFLRDYLLDHPEALREYNRLKAANADGGPEAYWKAKYEFLAKILASRS